MLPARAGIGRRTRAGGAPAAPPPGVHLGQEQADAEHRALARRAGGAHLAAHQVGQHLGNGQAQARPPLALAWADAACRARKGSKMRSMSCADARGRCLRSRSGHFAQHGARASSRALRRELDGVAQQVDEDLASPLFVGAHHLGKRRPRRAERQALGSAPAARTCPHDLAAAVGKGHGLDGERELAGLDARDVQRALDQAQQVLATRAGSR
jgi:hypothetical protein